MQQSFCATSKDNNWLKLMLGVCMKKEIKQAVRQVDNKTKLLL